MYKFCVFIFTITVYLNFKKQKNKYGPDRSCEHIQKELNK